MTSLDVLVTIAALTECLAAHGTSVWLLAGMNALMILEFQ